MGAFRQADPLAAALDELSVFGSAQDRETIGSLRDRLSARRLRVLVAGEAKRGKSTLVNALLGWPVLPTGVLPLTALATTVRFGKHDSVTAGLAGGRTETYPVSALAQSHVPMLEVASDVASALDDFVRTLSP